MGRKKINTEEKKKKLSVTISSNNAQKLNELEFTNKSKLINWLLKEHFGISQEGGSK
jgi:glutamine cyclotransferase